MVALFVFISMVLQKNEQAGEAEGKSRGGLSTKIHAAVDALGHLVHFRLTEGQASEYGEAVQLIEGFKADYVLADKGYDSNTFIAAIYEIGAQPVVPPHIERGIFLIFNNSLSNKNKGLHIFSF